jgi:acyl-CoA reductase-like NAD-dependent aldehyde dehydrogenase
VANKYRAAGQVCVCANRVYVQREILDRFAEHFKAKVEQLKLGHGLDSGVNHGPLTTRRGADRCVDLVADAVKHGAKVLTGGKRVGEGYHFEPTILVGASKAAKVYKEEMFSPIASLYAFDTEEEVCSNVWWSSGTKLSETRTADA